jgi:hypothetical protein
MKKAYRVGGKVPKIMNEKLALHEAGHAVVGLALGYVITEVVINPQAPEGHTGLVWLAEHPDPLCEGIVAWAGAAAEGVNYLVDEGDADILERFHFSARSFASLREAAKALVDEHRPAVELIARVLLERHHISGAMAKRLAFRACPELRRDATPTPRWLAARVHATAVDNAHKDAGPAR